MKRFSLLFVLLSITSAAFGQVATGIVTPLPPIAFGFSNSVVDQSGNVLIFDESFPGFMGLGSTTAPSSLTPQTHVIVVSPDGKTINGYTYTGTFQILGVGQNAVYALVNTFSMGTTTTGAPPMPVFTRQLVALHVMPGTWSLPTTLTDLPSINVASNQEVRLSLAVGANMPDTIALVSGSSIILPPLTASPMASMPHMVWRYTCDGLTFTTVYSAVSTPPTGGT
jgi:hypothetical protein